MSVEVKVPDLGESISEVEVSGLLKEPGETVDRDEPLIELESDKATVEVPAPSAGTVKEFVVEVGDVLQIGDLLARIEPGDGSSDTSDEDSAGDSDEDDAKDKDDAQEEDEKKEENENERDPDPDPGSGSDSESRIMPAARRLMEEENIDESDVEGTGPGGRISKEDVRRALQERGTGEEEDDGKSDDEAKPSRQKSEQQVESGKTAPAGERNVRRKRMSPIRRRIAERLVESQQTAALLTTFNEIDMSRVKSLRAEHQEEFTERYGVKLGFMSFFIKAVCDAVQVIPGLNAQIEGEEMVYHDYCDVGIAVGGGKGLVVPVIRDAQALDFGPLEQTIADYAERAQANKIDLAELEGGTFTISNGGVYGSLLSTPIINPPQSGVLGLHNIQDRPVAIDGQVEIRPMMYVALTYDHRLVDGREAVTFLKHIKHCVEQPERLLLKV